MAAIWVVTILCCPPVQGEGDGLGTETDTIAPQRNSGVAEEDLMLTFVLKPLWNQIDQCVYFSGKQSSS